MSRVTASHIVFCATSRALWGEQWQTVAADALGISRSSVLRYGNGEREIPRELFDRLSDILDDKLEDLAGMKPAINRAGGGGP